MDALKAEHRRLQQENQHLRAEVAALRQQVTTLQEELERLRAQLNQNSHNSHWPPSRDKSRRKRRTRSLRQKSGKAAGGQSGHPGHTLEFSAHPQQIETHRPTCCPECQTPFPAEQRAVATRRRQVFDLPPLELVVTEHRAETLVCGKCGAHVEGEFPPEVTQPTQYGRGIYQLATYLKSEQLLPYGRSQQLLADVFGVPLSPGTLENLVHHAAQRLRPVVARIHTVLRTQRVAHFDESGFYIGGQRYWLHSAGTAEWSYYAPHPRRGRAAMDDIAILPQFHGTAVHDGLAAYWSYMHCQHSLCNVHHVRELNGLLENTPQPWMQRFKWLLLSCQQRVARAKAAGLTALPPAQLAQIERLYDRLIQLALQTHPPPEGGWPRGKRGRVRKPKARNLAERLDKHKRAVLAFVYDFNVPFDNNLAERDLRMLKVQQKISGCFRSWQGAEDFCIIRSYTATLRKQGLSVWAALGALFSPECLLPRFPPV